jgi:hypothetical protein
MSTFYAPTKKEEVNLFFEKFIYVRPWNDFAICELALLRKSEHFARHPHAAGGDCFDWYEFGSDEKCIFWQTMEWVQWIENNEQVFCDGQLAFKNVYKSDTTKSVSITMKSTDVKRLLLSFLLINKVYL